jgi:serine/threonine protein kinase
VYLVKHKETKKTYALKEVSETELKYVIGEVITLSCIKHPALISLEGFAFATPSRDTLILTEFLAGGGLDSAIGYKNEEPEWLDATQKMMIMAGIAAGTAQLHSRMIIHRDLKPANILLTEDHKPMIADFGLAKFVKMSTRNTKCGTQPYMPPEAHAGKSSAPSIDIYALGFIFFELLTHRNPFDGISRISDLLSGRRAAFPRHFNPKLKVLINDAWALSPDDRPTAYGILQSLRDKDFWLSGTDEKRFMEYYDTLMEVTEPTIPQELKITKKIADSGDPLEQYNMAKHFLDPCLGDSMKREGIRYMEKSASSEFPPAMYDLGMILKETDPKRSYELITKASHKLYPPAIYMEGMLLFDNNAVKGHEIAAMRTLEKAGKFGYAQAFLELAERRATGRGIRKDLGNAKAFFAKVDKNEVSASEYSRVEAIIKENS